MLQRDGCEDRKEQVFNFVRGISVEALVDGWLQLLLTCLATLLRSSTPLSSVLCRLCLSACLWLSDERSGYLLYPVISYHNEKLKQRNNVLNFKYSAMNSPPLTSNGGLCHTLLMSSILKHEVSP